MLGVDLQACSPLSLRYVDDRVSTMLADVLRLQPAALLAHSPGGFNAVLSDMAPSTTGASAVDGPRSAALSLAAARLALGEDGPGVLKKGGSLLVKLLEGPGGGREELQELCKGRFARVLWARPKATRAESREVFLVGLQRTR